MREDTSLCIKETFGVDQSNVYPVFALKSKHVSVMQLIFSLIVFFFSNITTKPKINSFSRLLSAP